MARVGARPEDWKTQPMPARTARLAFTREFSPADFARLQRGLVPESMDDKWFIVWQDGALWCHRSWTGLCVYCLRFAPAGEGVAVSEALVNREPGQYGGHDAHDVQTLGYLLETFLAFSRRFP